MLVKNEEVREKELSVDLNWFSRSGLQGTDGKVNDLPKQYEEQYVKIGIIICN